MLQPQWNKEEPVPITQITPDQARKILEESKDAVYLDVRSTPEFANGHAAGAINIPLMNYNQGSGMMTPNPDFQQVVESVLPKGKKLVVGCQMGGRSQRACELMQQLGYQDLSNIRGGFGGSPEQPGWAQLGYPVSTEAGEGVGYESLLKKSTK